MSVPDFYYTKPKERPRVLPLIESPQATTSSQESPSKQGSAEKTKQVVRVPIRTAKSAKEYYQKNKNKSPWCRPSRRRKRYRVLVLDDSDEDMKDEEYLSATEDDTLLNDQEVEQVSDKPEPRSAHHSPVAHTSAVSPATKADLSAVLHKRERSPCPKSPKNSPKSTKHFPLAAEPPCLASTSSNDSTSRDSGMVSAVSQMNGESSTYLDSIQEEPTSPSNNPKKVNFDIINMVI